MSEVEYVPLASDSAALLAGIDRVVFQDDIFYVLDKGGKQVVLFDRQGKHLKTIHKVGSGPGEYTELGDMDVDRSGNVYLSDLNTHSILVYRTGNENDVETIRIGEPFLDFAVTDSHIYIGSIYRDGALKVNLAAWDRKENHLEVLKENTRPEGNDLPFMASHYLYRSGERLFYYERFLDSIYLLQDGEAKPYVTLRSSRLPSPDEIAAWVRGNPVERLQKSRQYLSDIMACCETSDYIFVQAFGSVYALLSKKSGQTCCVRRLKKEVNVLGRGLQTTAGERFVSYLVPTSEQLQEILPTVADKNRQEALAAWNEECNPLLVLFHFAADSLTPTSFTP